MMHIGRYTTRIRSGITSWVRRPNSGSAGCRVDVAAYRIDWKNVQQAVTDPGCGYLFVANAGSATEQGRRG